jgi:two-component system, OmpR family, KDP operon response regulator KdpE
MHMTSVPTTRVLVVDNDASLRHALQSSLSATGYKVDEAGNGTEAVDFVRQWPVDVVLLDINMPGMNGIEACRRIRATAPRIAILMITVRDAEDDQVQALDAGADDYITKPFRFRELTARLRAVLRRTKANDEPQAVLLRAGTLELDLEHRTLRKAGTPIHLPPTEFELLGFLMQHKGVPLTHTKLLRAIWGPEYGNELEYLRSYVKMLRKKIEDDPARPEYILTETRIGYRFCDPEDPDLRMAAAHQTLPQF